MEALERMTDALEWDPFELPLREQDSLPEGVRTLLLAELTHMLHLVQTAISWIQTLDAAMARRIEVSEPTPRVRITKRREHDSGPLPAKRKTTDDDASPTPAQSHDARAHCPRAYTLGRIRSHRSG
jgi:hypothetical protein